MPRKHGPLRRGPVFRHAQRPRRRQTAARARIAGAAIAVGAVVAVGAGVALALSVRASNARADDLRGQLARIERESAERRAVQVLRERDWDARAAQRKTEDDEKESRRIAEEIAAEDKRLGEQAVTATATFEPMLTFGDLYTG